MSYRSITEKTLKNFNAVLSQETRQFVTVATDPNEAYITFNDIYKNHIDNCLPIKKCRFMFMDCKRYTEINTCKGLYCKFRKCKNPILKIEKERQYKICTIDAYDTLDHEILPHKMCHCGVRGLNYQRFKSNLMK